MWVSAPGHVRVYATWRLASPERVIPETETEPEVPFTMPGGSCNPIYACAKSFQLCRNSATPWTVGFQAPLSMGLSHIKSFTSLSYFRSRKPDSDSKWEGTTKERKYQKVGWLVAILEADCYWYP